MEFDPSLSEWLIENIEPLRDGFHFWPGQYKTLKLHTGDGETRPSLKIIPVKKFAPDPAGFRIVFEYPELLPT